MTALLASVLVASVAGSPHCAGMCGGVAMFCGGAGQCGGVRGMRATALYHLARLVSYALVGLVAGGFGRAVDAGGALVGVQHTASIAAGLMVAIVGASLLARAREGVAAGVSPPAWFGRLVARMSAIAMRLKPDARAIMIGGMTPMLPCGWLWAFVAVAAGSGGAFVGAAIMVVFWAGTVPALVATGLGGSLLVGNRRRWATALAGMLMIAVGVHTAFVRGPLASRTVRTTPDVALGGVEDRAGRPESRLPCCHIAEEGP